MFIVNNDKSIYITRGDIATLEVSANLSDNETYEFKIGDVVRFKVFEKKKCDSIALTKDVRVLAPTDLVTISLSSADTRIGEIINKPVDYWYEIELNPDTTPQTIIGYDADGPKILKLFPEGDGSNES